MVKQFLFALKVDSILKFNLFTDDPPGKTHMRICNRAFTLQMPKKHEMSQRSRLE